MTYDDPRETLEADMQTIEIEVGGRKYLWNGSTWTDDRFLRPPTKVRGQLLGQLVRRLKHSPLKRLDIDVTLRAAEALAEEGDLDEAVKLAKKALRADPRHVGAATALANLLRKARLPRQAIKVTDDFTRRHSAELHTVRAAAFADISDWDQAEKSVRRALSLDKAEASPETLQVMARVVSARSREAA